MRLILRAVSFLAAVSLAMGRPGGLSAEEVLIILHTSEHHGQVLPLERMGQPREAGMAARATLIERIRNGEPVLLVVDSGDLLIGTPMSSVFRGEPDIKAMNLMGYGAMAAGNHEFDFGLDHLQTMQELAAFPILCSNLAGRNVELPCREFTMLRAGELSIGVLGLLGRTNFPDTFNREIVRMLELRDPIDTARRLARDLKERLKADLVVAITHQEDEEDLALLAQVPGLDATIGGHTPGFDGLRTAGDAAPVPVAERPGTVFVKTHRQGRTVGRLALTLDRAAGQDGRPTVIKAEAHNLPVGESLPPHPAVEELIQGYVARMERLGSTVVGRSLVDLEGENAIVRVRETNLGNLLADLARLEFGADVALINSGQIRDSIPAGAVDLTRVLRVLPFNSTLVTFTLFGRDLRTALENSVSRLPAANGRFLQVSGLQLTYDVDAPAGSRIRSVMVGDKPLDPMGRYSVVTDMFLADGGDGYTVFRQAQDRVERQVPLRDLLLQALKAAPLKASIEHRLAVEKMTISPPPP
ncbi:MAG TPA: 5'-nucleotidase C-terminal domain-containing protein [Nitrospiraceae bacterium]|nr:5'-nucleotidase C-terminal domain-containing protein [Nitrospiraceae bacterium]